MSCPVVVGLGSVDPALVVDELGTGLHFVAEPDPDQLAAAAGAIARADAVVDRALLDQMPALRVVARTGVGVEKVDLLATEQRGIPVVITPGTGTHAVAEGAIAMALGLLKRHRVTTDLVREGRWTERSGIVPGDLEGAVLGIIGYGRIGRRLAQLGAAFGMEVLSFDPYVVDAPGQVSLAQLGARADVISLHLPLTAQTRGIVDEAFLARVRPGSVLINCGRGGLVDLDAAQRALEDGRLAGLGLDVFDEEPPAHHPVFERDDVILSPHLTGLSARAQQATFRAAARGVRDVLEGKEPAAVAEP